MDFRTHSWDVLESGLIAVMTNEMNEARIGTARSLACVQLTFLISY